jgi:rod shape-determining protein MreD
MSWWLLLPLAYLAMGLNQVCAGELAWRGAAPDFLLLLWSVLAVRTGSARTMFQAGLLGLLADLSAGSPLGLTPAVLVSVTFLAGRISRKEGPQSLNWLLWSFPLMLLSLGAIHACGWMFHASAVSPPLLVRHTYLTVTVTFGWGVGLKLVYWITGRLLQFPRESVPRELQASSFFLSR